MTDVRTKLIEMALPLDAINTASAREKSVPRRGHPQTLHLWWARRPLAACRAMLFAQYVDDPSAVPEEFPTEAAQDSERNRIFRIMSELVEWENASNEGVLNAARYQIARSIARRRISSGLADNTDVTVAGGTASPAAIRRYLEERAPVVHDPFSGGGSVAVEAQRLGLPAVVSDLNPVSVLIGRALVEFPKTFEGKSPVNPEGHAAADMGGFEAGVGLAEDIKFYGEWILDRARSALHHLYPSVEVPVELRNLYPDAELQQGSHYDPLGWIWARTVPSPNPATAGTPVPLISSYWVSKRKGAEVWLEPDVNREKGTYSFRIRLGPPPDTEFVSAGTKAGRGNFKCILTGEPIPAAFIRESAQAGRMGACLLAIIADGGGARLTLPATKSAGDAAKVETPVNVPDSPLPKKALGFRVQSYGITRHRELFSPRQLVVLTTLVDLVGKARELVLEHAEAAGLGKGESLEDGGKGARAYADCIAAYLALAVSKASDYNSTICTWNVIGGSIRSTFSRQTLQMTWDFFETNPLADMTGSWSSCLSWVVDAVRSLKPDSVVRVLQRDARNPSGAPLGVVICTDPPYYDNVPYADLSDFYYVWLRKCLLGVFRTFFEPCLCPRMPNLWLSLFVTGARPPQRTSLSRGCRKPWQRCARWPLMMPLPPFSTPSSNLRKRAAELRQRVGRNSSKGYLRVGSKLCAPGLSERNAAVDCAKWGPTPSLPLLFWSAARGTRTLLPSLARTFAGPCAENFRAAWHTSDTRTSRR